ncbi:MAG: DUF4337 domain-containing protein [Archangium sp.]|nr:DUF4337 domain-containing protein [Archangium sp.]
MGSPDENDPLNRRVSVVVAIAATFLTICNVKDSNIVQAMQQSQAEVVNRWAYFQAKSTKQQVAGAAADEIDALRSTVTDPAALVKLDALVAQWRADVERYEHEKKEIEASAHAAEKVYATLNLRDDQFDMSEASLSLSIALMGITALTRQKWLLVLGTVFAGFGIFMAICGFASLSVHPDALASLLT